MTRFSTRVRANCFSGLAFNFDPSIRPSVRPSVRSFVRSGSCLVSFLSSPRAAGSGTRAKENERAGENRWLNAQRERTRDRSLNRRVSSPSLRAIRPETLRSILSLLSFSTRFILLFVRSCYVLRCALGLSCIISVSTFLLR